MSFKKNILFGYPSQFYVTFIGIIMVPIYIKYMGIAAYGLVGFFSMVQAWFNLLDLGLSPTISRETARLTAGSLRPAAYKKLVRGMEIFFFTTAVIGSFLLFIASEFIATKWLKGSPLDVEATISSIQLMSIAVGVRWCSSLYRGIVTGSGRLVWLSGYNMAIASLRFLGVFPIFIYIGTSPVVFFEYQLLVSIVELIGLIAYGIVKVVPKTSEFESGFETDFLKKTLKFSGGIAFTSAVWAVVTQLDKLVLSKYVPLTEYGYFTLAVLGAGGVLIVSAPVANAVMQKMAELEAKNHHNQLIETYRQTTQLVAVFSGSVAIAMAVLPRQILYLWTADMNAVVNASLIFALYAIGNGILSLASFPFYLQYAKGDLKLHVIGNIAFVILYIPGIIFASIGWGGIGAGYIWVAMNLLSLFIWLPFVHNKFEMGLNYKWYIEDIFKIVIPMILIGLLIFLLNIELNSSRIYLTAIIFLSWLMIFIVGAISSSFLRNYFCRFIGIHGSDTCP